MILETPEEVMRLLDLAITLETEEEEEEEEKRELVISALDSAFRRSVIVSQFVVV